MKTPDQFSTKQLLEFFDSGIITAEQLNHLVRTLRADREEYALQAEEYQRKYQREHIDTNRWKNRAELAEARIELVEKQTPVFWHLGGGAGDLVTNNQGDVSLAERFNWPITPLFAKSITTEPVRKTNAWHHGCKFEGWQCFHCSEVFETVGGARDHFGADPTKEPGCMIKVKYGDERGLEMELRKTEKERDDLQYQISNESTDADLRIQQMQGEHAIALRREEEKGYARGLDDGRKLQPSSAVAVPALELLRTIFDLYESGVDCYEDPDDLSNYVGKAFELDDETFDACVSILNGNPLASLPCITEQEAPGIDFEDLQHKKNDPLHMAVSNWYARLTGCDAVTDEGEHVGYCCPMKMMDELESILTVPMLTQESGHNYSRLIELLDPAMEYVRCGIDENHSGEKWDEKMDEIYNPLAYYLRHLKSEPVPAQVASNPLVDTVFAASHKKAVDTHSCPHCSHECAQAAAIPDWLIEMSEQMRTQDNRGTSHPFFQVRCKRYIVTEQGYNEFGYELCTDDGVIYRSYAAEEDDLEKLLTEDYPEFCEQWRIDQGEETVDDAISSFDPTEDDLPEGVRLVYVQETEEIVSTHLTEVGARQFIRRKQHDYPKLYTYAESAYWSPQLRQLQDWIISLSATPKPERKFVDLRQVVEDGSK